MAIIGRGVVHGSNIVFPDTLSLPEGTEVVVHIEPVAKVQPEREPANETDFMEQPWFGMWKDRKDMDDSSIWVRRERESWSPRLTKEG